MIPELGHSRFVHPALNSIIPRMCLSFILIGWAFFGEGTAEKKAWGVGRGEAVPEIQRTKTTLDLLF